MKEQKEILKKLGIDNLNQMQLEAHETILANSETILLSPTGTGKTLAFLLPLIEGLDPEIKKVQALVVVPSRELAIQIEQVTREMGSGYKVVAVYGGKSGSKDKIELKNPPAILIGTPGRVLDHLNRENFDSKNIQTLVLDEFDKSLEIGFKEEMEELVSLLKSVSKKILVSATPMVKIPNFLGIKSKVKRLDYLNVENKLLNQKKVISLKDDKLELLKRLLENLSNKKGIVFCNFKNSIEQVSSYLWKNKIRHASFFGTLEQIDRERSLIKFRNGTHQFLIATDLAARGIDVPELDFIIHYDLPLKESEFIHRNGRTARMNNDGTAYILETKDCELPDYIKELEVKTLKNVKPNFINKWETLYISGGRRDKISKGDIVGLFFKKVVLKKDDVGVIELKQDCAYVAVSNLKSKELIKTLDNTKLKKKKVRVSLLK